MRISRWFFTLPLATAFACTDPVKDDTAGDPSSRQIAPSGVIRGTVLYQGPRPCSANGHIIGNAIVLVFDRRAPPPPVGLATTAVNFAAITGDALFANEPRWGGSKPYCPAENGFTETITANTPFAISPLAGASYVIQSFFDTTGNFFPLIKFRELPEQGDVGGGDIDTADALKPINQNPNYQPIFEPIDVGIPRKSSGGAGLIPIFDIPPEGYVADNVQVTVGQVLSLTRPYFYAQGLTASLGGMGGTLQLKQAQSSDAFWGGDITGITGAAEIGLDPKKPADPKAAEYAPILTIPQDIQSFAPPVQPLAAVLNLEGPPDQFEAALPHIRLRWAAGTPQTAKYGVQAPFNMQLAPFTGTSAGGGFRQWQGEWLDTSGPTPIWKAQYIPDSVYKAPEQMGQGSPTPFFWPLIILSKLVDDPKHTVDPASLQAQGSATEPVVIMQGITLWGGDNPTTSATTGDNDSLFQTVSTNNPILGDANHYIDKAGNPVIFNQDHLTAILRPATICFNSLFDPSNSDKRGVIVTPYLKGLSTDPTPVTTDIVPSDLLTNGDPARAQVTNLVKPPPNWQPGQPPAVPGCLPKGRYAINVVYPDGQAWTVPNEAGACTGAATGEGDTNWNTLQCTVQGRNVLQSQGPRAVVEIVGPSNPKNCVSPTGANNTVPSTPKFCLTNP